MAQACLTTDLFSMQNNLKLSLLAIGIFVSYISHAQSLVLGGFTSFVLSNDSSQISSSSGGGFAVNDKVLSCVQLQSGNSIGGIELYSHIGDFNDDCKRAVQIEKSANLLIYPNPGFGQYNLLATDAIGFYITDITGKTVFQYTELNSEEYIHPFDISNLAEACYIVLVKLNDGKITSLPIIKTIQ
jgi:hypothetical protein